jgi:predicted GH43/DUF377 family glycosyl hydrolase
MKNLFSFFASLFITLILTSPAYTQDGEVLDTVSGTQWDQYEGNPIIKPGKTGWNKGMVYAPTVIMFKDTLRMWYMGSTDYGFNGIIHIGYAWSLEGITWHQYSENPVFSPGKDDWDYPHIVQPIVFADGDTLRMWYGGGNVLLGNARQREVMRIGYAVSVDGINWNRLSDPVIKPPNPPAWDQDGVLPGGVIKENGIFKMWFGGGVGPYGYPPASSKWSIGYATSSDCIHWDLQPDPVVLHGDNSTDFDETSAFAASVIRTNEGYYMWYSGHSHTAVVNGKPQGKIGYANSSDGINWTKYYANPIVSPTSVSQQWTTGYYTPSVLFDGEQFHMWFAGWQEGGGMIAIGYATSVSDKINGTGIEDDLLNRVPKENKLLQNFPNPFNPLTTISYSIPEQAYVTLKVYDILGDEIETLVNDEKPAGSYLVRFNASHFASGTYFCKLQTDNFIQTKKLVLIK